MTASSTGTNSLRLTRIGTPIVRLDSRAARQACMRSADFATADAQPVYQELHEILAAGGVLGARYPPPQAPSGKAGNEPIAIAEEGHGGVLPQPGQHGGKHRVGTARCLAFPRRRERVRTTGEASSAASPPVISTTRVRLVVMMQSRSSVTVGIGHAARAALQGAITLS